MTKKNKDKDTRYELYKTTKSLLEDLKAIIDFYDIQELGFAERYEKEKIAQKMSVTLNDKDNYVSGLQAKENEK